MAAKGVSKEPFTDPTKTGVLLPAYSWAEIPSFREVVRAVRFVRSFQSIMPFSCDPWGPHNANDRMANACNSRRHQKNTTVCQSWMTNMQQHQYVQTQQFGPIKCTLQTIIKIEMQPALKCISKKKC